MASRVGAYIRRNHLGLIAVFIALGGTTYAATTVDSGDIAKNAVRSKHIKAKQVKPGDLSPKARDGCPDGTRSFDPLCVRPATGSANFTDAVEFCRPRNLRLPGLTEAKALNVAHDIPGVSGSEQFWTDELNGPYAYVGGDYSDEGVTNVADLTSTGIVVLCVTEPREGGLTPTGP